VDRIEAVAPTRVTMNIRSGWRIRNATFVRMTLGAFVVLAQQEIKHHLLHCVDHLDAVRRFATR
jgi:hypothetical protein